MYGNKIFISVLKLFLFPSIFLEKLQAKQYTKPILKNSTGEMAKNGVWIHLFAPFTTLAIEEGIKGIEIISIVKITKNKTPILKSHLSGFSLDKNHIIKIDKIPVINCLNTKWYIE